MKNLVALLFFNACFFQLMAQPVISWQRTYGGSKDDYAKSMLVAPDGDYVLVGHTASTNFDVTGGHGLTDWWAVKVSPFGEIKWKTALGGSDDEFEPLIQQAADGGFGIFGAARSSDGDISVFRGAIDFWVVKLSPQGTLVWEKTFGGSSYETPTTFISTKDGGFVAAGKTGSTDFDGTGNHGNTDLFVVKLDGDGTTEWIKVLGGSKAEEMYFITQTVDHGYIIAGSTESNDGDVSGFHGTGGFSDCWIIKLDSGGNLEWAKTLGGSLTDIPKSILQTNDGGYIIASSSNSANGDLTFNHGSKDYWVFELSATGDLLWQKTYGGTGSDYPFDVINATDGGYLINGNSISNDGDVSGNHGCTDVWILKIDSIGNILWQKSYGGNDCDDRIYSIKPLTNGDYIMAGSTTSITGDGAGNHGFFDAWVLRIKATGEIVWKKLLGGTEFDEAYFIKPIENGSYIVGCRSVSNNGDVSGQHGNGDYWLVKLSGDLVNAVGDPNPPPFLNLEVSPNPGSDVVYFNTATEEPLFDIEITDLLGKHQIHQTLGKGAGLDISMLGNGIYFALAKAPSGNVYAARFIKGK